MGPEGMREGAEVGFKRAHALAERLGGLPGWELAFPDRQFLNEFPMRVAKGPAVIRKLARRGILGPLDVRRRVRERNGVVPVTCTEVKDPQALDDLVAALDS